LNTPHPANAQNTLESGRFLHPFTDFAEYKQTGGRTYVGGEGIFIIDHQGNRLLDGMSGLWCTNLGYSQASIKTAITAQLERLPFYNSFFNCTTDVTLRLADQLCSALPDGFEHVFFTNSGSEANDTNIRLVHRYFDLIDQPEKKLIIARTNGYHGSTIAGASLGGMKGMHEQMQGLPYVHHVDQPYTFAQLNAHTPEQVGQMAAQSLADKIDALGADQVAAFIAEPIQGAGGVIIPPANYWPLIEDICRSRNVLIISDEVICGFGRTGQWWGCQTFGFEPDLITFAKAVTNGYQPLGGAAVSNKIADVLTAGGGEFAHGFTYSGHPVACAAGLATLEIYQSSNLLDEVYDHIAPYWAEALQKLSAHPIIGEVRSQGMLGALELVRSQGTNERIAPDAAAAVYCRNFAIGHGFMVRQVGDSIILSPPLIIQPSEIDQLIKGLWQALDATASAFKLGA
jgi:putrescine aminotransferase